MSTPEPENPPAITEAEIIKKLGDELLFIVGGLRKGSIKSKPIVVMSDDAENWPMLSLEEHIWQVFGECGIKEARAAK